MPRSEDFNRDEVIDKAKDTFWFQGYNGTSMQDLVDATGLNRSSLYNSFGSKMELYQQSLNRYQVDNAQLFERALQQNRNAIETIGLIFLYMLDDINGDSQKKGCMMVNCGTELGNQNEALAELLAADQKQLVAIFEELVVKGQQDGSVHNHETSSRLAHYLLNAYRGFRITGMQITDQDILKSIIQNILKTIA